MRKFRYKNVEELPKKICLDICSLCQLNCAACWVRKDEELINKNGGFGYVSFETFKTFLDKHSFLEEIEISKTGEIFLNPDLDKILEYAYEKNVTLNAFSGVNLNSLSEQTAENLVKYQLKCLRVSIDGATQETYSIYRRGGDLNKVIENIKKINKYKEKYNSKFPILIYKFILFGHNEHEIEAAKKLAEQLNMQIEFAPNCIEEYSPIKDKEKVIALTGLDDVGCEDDVRFQRYKSGLDKWYFCLDLYKKPSFNYNGDLYGCCVAYLKPFGGNLFKDGLLKALNNKKFLYAKLMLSDFKYGPKYDIPCNNCLKYKKLKEKRFRIRNR